MFKRALVSVSEKRGLVEALKPLVEQGTEIVSTGGTAKYLRENSIKVTEVEDVTGFPEVLGGRVKTLHPHIHMGLLALDSNPSHTKDLQTHKVKTFDLLICNLYPFEETVKRTEDLKERIENIDIGGVTLLRAAAKNFQRITVLSDPSDYKILSKGQLDEDTRRELAVKAFLHTSNYDLQIAQSMTQKNNLRYGENPHQKAKWLPIKADGLHSAEVLQGKELSYNNILDLESAVRLVQQFTGTGAVIVKHNNPCGAAIAEHVSDAFRIAFQADPVSCFGGIVAVNGEVDKRAADLMTSLFLECVIAPSFSTEALETFKSKKNLRILRWPGINHKNDGFEARSVMGSWLVQEVDQVHLNPEAWKVYLPQHPEKVGTVKDLNPSVVADIQFGIAVVASLKSNAIAIVKNKVTLGLGMGQVNRVDSVKLALGRQTQFHPQAKAAVLVGDAFFPFPDSIELLEPGQIDVVVQPGGSIKDADVIKRAQEKGLIMVITGQRHFRH